MEGSNPKSTRYISTRHIRTQGKAILQFLFTKTSPVIQVEQPPAVRKSEQVSLGVLSHLLTRVGWLDHSVAISHQLWIHPPWSDWPDVQQGKGWVHVPVSKRSLAQFPVQPFSTHFLFQKSDHLADILKKRPNHRKLLKGHCANLTTGALTLRWSEVKVRRSSLDGWSLSNRIVSAPLE